MREPLTIKKTADLLASADEDLLFGQFLDDFRNEQNDKYALIKDEPNLPQEAKLFACILAATAHKLANDSGLPVPEWVFKDNYIYERAYYPHNTEVAEAKEYLRENSPAEFVQRNIFLGSNVLSRV